MVAFRIAVTLPFDATGGLVERDEHGVLATGLADDHISIHEWGFGKTPTRHHTSAPLAEAVLPGDLTILGADRGDPAVGGNDIKLIPVDRRRATRAVGTVIRILVRQLGFPEDFAIGTRGSKDGLAAARIARGVDSITCDGDARIAAAESFRRPEQLWDGIKTQRQALVWRDTIAVRSAITRPTTRYRCRSSQPGTRLRADKRLIRLYKIGDGYAPFATIYLEHDLITFNPDEGCLHGFSVSSRPGAFLGKEQGCGEQDGKDEAMCDLFHKDSMVLFFSA